MRPAAFLDATTHEACKGELAHDLAEMKKAAKIIRGARIVSALWPLGWFTWIVTGHHVGAAEVIAWVTSQMLLFAVRDLGVARLEYASLHADHVFERGFAISAVGEGPVRIFARRVQEYRDAAEEGREPESMRLEEELARLEREVVTQRRGEA